MSLNVDGVTGANCVSRQSRPRVCLVAEALPPYHSGAALAAFRLARRLNRRHSGRALLVGRQRDPSVPEADVPVHGVRLRLNVSDLRRSRLRWLLTDLLHAAETAARLWPLLVRLRNDYDVVHLFGSSWFTLLSVPVARALGKPVIVEMTLLGKDDPLSLARASGWKQRLLPRRLLFHLFRRADAVIGNSHALEEAYGAAALTGQRFGHIPRPVDAEQFRPATADERLRIRQRLGLPRDGVIVLFVGGITKRKGVHTLIQAFGALSEEDVHLVLAGPTVQYDAAYVRQIEMAARRTPNVTMTGFTEQVPLYMQAADVFAFPSTREGFPNAVLEAMASGLAVVASDIPEIARSQIRDGLDGLLFPVGDAEGLSQQLARVVGDPDLRRRLGQAARDAVVRKYAPSRIDSMYEQLYDEVWPSEGKR